MADKQRFGNADWGHLPVDLSRTGFPCRAEGCVRVFLVPYSSVEKVALAAQRGAAEARRQHEQEAHELVWVEGSAGPWVVFDFRRKLARVGGR